MCAIPVVQAVTATISGLSLEAASLTACAFLASSACASSSPVLKAAITSSGEVTLRKRSAKPSCIRYFDNSARAAK